jgi:carboxylesterase type B
MILAVGASPVTAANDAPTVVLAGGTIAGAAATAGGAAFKGIPFAQPPVGPLWTVTSSHDRPTRSFKKAPKIAFRC